MAIASGAAPARLGRGRVATAATRRERDLWVALARVAGLDSLGDWRAASARLDAEGGGAFTHWLLARLDVSRQRHQAALERLARDSARLPVSLRLDLDAHRALAARDTAAAIHAWEAATRRYAVLRVPFDLIASLWPLRRDLAAAAAARGDSSRAARARRASDAPIGFVDIVVLRPAMERLCAPWRALVVP